MWWQYSFLLVCNEGNGELPSSAVSSWLSFDICADVTKEFYSESIFWKLQRLLMMKMLPPQLIINNTFG